MLLHNLRKQKKHFRGKNVNQIIGGKKANRLYISGIVTIAHIIVLCQTYIHLSPSIIIPTFSFTFLVTDFPRSAPLQDVLGHGPNRTLTETESFTVTLDNSAFRGWKRWRDSFVRRKEFERNGKTWWLVCHVAFGPFEYHATNSETQRDRKYKRTWF